MSPAHDGAYDGAAALPCPRRAAAVRDAHDGVAERAAKKPVADHASDADDSDEPDNSNADVNAEAPSSPSGPPREFDAARELPLDRVQPNRSVVAPGAEIVGVDDEADGQRPSPTVVEETS